MRAPLPVLLRLLAPSSGALLNLDQPTSLVAQVESGIDRVATVRFLANGAIVGNNPTGKPVDNWTPKTAGPYQLVATAYDAAGNLLAQSDPVNVQASHLLPPQVSIVAPTDGTVLPNTQTGITIQVQASDADGSITGIELLIDHVPVAQSASALLTSTWVPTPGWHEIEATATDDSGLQTEATTVKLYVGRAVGNTVLKPASANAVATKAREIHVSWAAPQPGNPIAATVVERRISKIGSWQEIAVVNFMDSQDGAISDSPATANFEFYDHQVEPEHYYNYRVAYLTRDGSGARGAYSDETAATTRIDLPHFVPLDLGQEFAGGGIVQSLAHPGEKAQSRTRRTAGRRDRRVTQDVGGNNPVTDLGEGFEPLWIADNGSVLLRMGDPGSGKYVFRQLDGQTAQINDPDFTAHRLTRDGSLVVGERKLNATPGEPGVLLPHPGCALALAARQPVRSPARAGDQPSPW